MKHAALSIVAICTVVFILQYIFPITSDFSLMSAEVLAKPWTLITSMFLHGGIDHLIYNMIALALFGTVLENIIGSRRFIIIYFISGLIAGIGAAVFYPAALGASGAIFGVLGCLAMLRPRMTVYVGYVPMPMAVAAAVWAAGDLLGMVAPDQVAHAAHLFGLFFGIVVGLYYRKQFSEKIIGRKIEKIPEKEVRSWEEKWLRSSS